MKKIINLVAASLFVCGNLLAGGLVTNTNQSASYVRLPARDASTSIDAVYFNPAGLMQLNNGLHFSLSNQTIFQTREVRNDYKNLNADLYKGEITAPFFPSIYAVYKMDKWAFSFGFNPIGGGGGATYDTGLPSFELAPSDLVPALAPAATAYRMDTFFEGSSIFFGYQGGISYKINDMISVFGGVRYVTAKNTYNGHLKNIELNYLGNWTKASAIFSGLSTDLGIAATSLQALIDGGAGSFTIAQVEAGGYINAEQRAKLEGGLRQLGYPQAAIDALTVDGAQTPLKDAAAKFAGTAILLADKEADVEQTASGITPIVGVNITLSERLNIGLKYEFSTKLEFTNDTKSDILTGFNGTTPVTMFPDKAKFRGDIPAMLAAGIDYKIMENLGLSLGAHYFFDKAADYGKKIDGAYVSNDKVIDNNYLEVAGGLEYNINRNILVSAGYLLSKTGVNSFYQSDLSYSLTSSTVGIGGAYKFNEKVMLNLGLGYTFYQEDEKTLNHVTPSGQIMRPTEYYGKDNLFIGIGVDFSL